MFLKQQDSQALLKAKYCPRAMPVQHFMNSDDSVQGISSGDFVLGGFCPERI